jgi:hypothetical protein
MNANDDFSICQKSVVQVFVKKGDESAWKSVGTGFVVSQSQCVTCFHVIIPDNKANIEDANQRVDSERISVKVKFWMDKESEGKSKVKTQETARERKSRDLEYDERIVKVTFVSPMAEYDLAVLSLCGSDSLPDGVEIARLALLDDLSSADFLCYGYAERFESKVAVMMPASGKFKKKGQSKTRRFWWVDSNDFEPGFSGAPLFEESSRFVLGMFCEGHKKGQKGLVVGHGDIRRLCERLVDFAVFDVDHESPLRSVEAEMAKRLASSQGAVKAVANAFDITSASDATTVCSTLLSTDQTVLKIASTFTDLILSLEREKKSAERRAVVNAYLALLAGIFKQGTVKEMRRSILQGQKVLLVEAASHSIAELLMAAVDGTVEHLTIVQKGPEILEGDRFVKMRESPDSRESDNAERQLDFIGEQLAEIMGYDWEDDFLCIGDAKKRAEKLNAIVEVYSKLGRTLVLVDDNGLREEPEGAIPKGYSALVVLKLKNPADEQRKSQHQALSPLEIGREPRGVAKLSGKSTTGAGRKNAVTSSDGKSQGVQGRIPKNGLEGRRKVSKKRRST